jgi:hypothetical protein
VSLRRDVSPIPLCAPSPSHHIDTHPPFPSRRRVITSRIHSHHGSDSMSNPHLSRCESDSKAPLMTPTVPLRPQPHRRPRHPPAETTPTVQTHQPHHLQTLFPRLHQLLFLASLSLKTIHRSLPYLSLEDHSFPVSTRQLSSVIRKSLQL